MPQIIADIRVPVLGTGRLTKSIGYRVTGAGDVATLRAGSEVQLVTTANSLWKAHSQTVSEIPKHDDNPGKHEKYKNLASNGRSRSRIHMCVSAIKSGQLATINLRMTPGECVRT